MRFWKAIRSSPAGRRGGKGLLPKVESPSDGRVVAAGGGQVLIESVELYMELRAGSP